MAEEVSLKYQRACIPQFVDTDLCNELAFVHDSSSSVGYRPFVSSATLHHLLACGSGGLLWPLLQTRARILEAVEEAFGCHFELEIEFTGLIGWGKGASIGWHSDNNQPYLKQRHFSAVLYLSSHGLDFSGGEFQFQQGTPSTILPTKGMLLMYAAGEDNTHRVNPVTSGRRLTLTLWFTRDPSFKEDSWLLPRITRLLSNRAPDKRSASESARPSPSSLPEAAKSGGCAAHPALSHPAPIEGGDSNPPPSTALFPSSCPSPPKNSRFCKGCSSQQERGTSVAEEGFLEVIHRATICPTAAVHWSSSSNSQSSTSSLFIVGGHAPSVPSEALFWQQAERSLLQQESSTEQEEHRWMNSDQESILGNDVGGRVESTSEQSACFEGIVLDDEVGVKASSMKERGSGSSDSNDTSSRDGGEGHVFGSSSKCLPIDKVSDVSGGVSSKRRQPTGDVPASKRKRNHPSTEQKAEEEGGVNGCRRSFNSCPIIDLRLQRLREICPADASFAKCGDLDGDGVPLQVLVGDLDDVLERNSPGHEPQERTGEQFGGVEKIVEAVGVEVGFGLFQMEGSDVPRVATRALLDGEEKLRGFLLTFLVQETKVIVHFVNMSHALQVLCFGRWQNLLRLCLPFRGARKHDLQLAALENNWRKLIRKYNLYMEENTDNMASQLPSWTSSGNLYNHN